jgi:hypothetical protein
MGRFEQFTDEEIVALWDGLAYDDGIRIYADSEPERMLVAELEDEWLLRAPSRALTLEHAVRELYRRGS